MPLSVPCFNAAWARFRQSSHGWVLVPGWNPPGCQAEIADPPTAHGISPIVTPGRDRAITFANERPTPTPTTPGLSKCSGSTAGTHFPAFEKLNTRGIGRLSTSATFPRPAMFDWPTSRKR